MRWVALRVQGEERVGLVHGTGERAEVSVLPPGPTLADLLHQGPRSFTDAAARAARPDATGPLADARLLPALRRPASVRVFTDRPNAPGPEFSFGCPHTILGPDEWLPVPPSCSALRARPAVAALLWRGGENLTPDAGAECIAGLVPANDWWASDLPGAKAEDFATSLGSVLTPPDQLTELAWTVHRGRPTATRQSTTGQAAPTERPWSWGERVAEASRGSRLAAGDVLLVHLELNASPDEPPLAIGDEVTVTGPDGAELRNRVVAGHHAAPLRPFRVRD